MGINVPSTEFKYAGLRYNFVASLSINDRKTKFPSYVLNNQTIINFWYSNQVNKYCIEGELEYIDTYGKVVNFLNHPYVNMAIIFTQLKEQSDGNIAIDYEKVSEFKHNFIVRNIEIVNRNKEHITYKFKLISFLWYDCIQSIFYSNYKNDQPEKLFDILKACIESDSKRLKIDSESFDNVNTNIKMYYMTSSTDNLFTVTRYLMSRLYYLENQDTSIKMFCYNEHDNKYKIVDIKKLQDNIKSSAITLGMNKTQIEQATYPEQNKLATVVSYPQTSSIESMLNKKIFTYQLSSNQLSSYNLSTDSIINCLNETEFSQDSKKYISYNDAFAGNSRFKNPEKQYSFYQNDLNIYDDLVNCLTATNSLVVNTTGQMLRKPLDMVFVQIPKDKNDMTDDSQSTKSDFDLRYKELTGKWLTAKVVHIVSPAKRTYRQNIVLFRNYSEDL